MGWGETPDAVRDSPVPFISFQNYEKQHHQLFKEVIIRGELISECLLEWGMMGFEFRCSVGGDWVFNKEMCFLILVLVTLE